MAAVLTGMTAAACTFRGHRMSIPVARNWAVDWLRELAGGQAVPDGTVADVALVLTELATNAIDHSRSGQGSFRVQLFRGVDLVIVEVLDQGGPGVPEIRDPAETAVDAQCPDDLEDLDGLPALRGRGLALVDHYTDRWWIDGDETGRTVIAEIRIPDRMT